MLSLGQLYDRALSIAYRSFRFMSGSPPPLRAATKIARQSLLKSLPRFASTVPLRCAMFAEWECPAIVLANPRDTEDESTVRHAGASRGGCPVPESQVRAGRQARPVRPEA